MFTKKDYVKYFLQIKKIEETMGERFLRYSEKLEDPELKKFFLRMHKEEMAHGRVADAMLEMFKDK
jgi:rubrerythrin